MIRLLRSLKPKDACMALICVAFICVQVFLDLKLPDYTKEITVLLSTESNVMGDYYVAGAKMLGCAFASALLAVVVGYLAAKIASDFSFSIRKAVFSKVSDFGSSEMKSFSTASLITRTTNDITQIQMIVAMGLQMLIKAPIMAVWAVFKIVGKSWELSAVTAIAVVALVTSIAIIMAIVLPKFKIVQKQIDDVNRVTRENLTGLRVVRAFNAEDYQEEKFEQANTSLMKTQLFTQRTMAFLFPVMTMIQSGLTLLIYYFGAHLIDNIALPLNDGSLVEIMTALSERANMLGDVVTFNSYAIYVIMSFMLLLMIFVMLPRAQVSAGRINEVLDAEISVKEGKGAGEEKEKPGTVEFKNVSFRYEDASENCLKNISFKVNPGETIAFIGATGSGKSTLVNLAARLYDATEGEVLINGKNIQDYTFDELYGKLGYVPQKAVLFSDTVKNNIAFGDSSSEISDEDISRAVSIAQAEEFVSNMQDGINSSIAQGGSNVSGGQKQRLSIARAIARKPEILIFDDSFSALDYKTDRELRGRIKSDLKGTTCMIVAQRIGTIRHADKIVVLDNGEAVGIGTHDELMENCKVYKEIALSQLSQAELA